MPSPDAYNRDLLTRIPLNASVVLDVGCGAGALEAAYRELNPRARLLGIERDAAAAAIARLRLDEVAAVDVEQEPWPFGSAVSVDCIIYGDVLQHLRDPINVLRGHAGLLRPNGVLLICVPNVEHWTMVARLFQGRWEYEPSGLLDIGHLRWFGQASILRALRGAGFAVREICGRVIQPDAAGRYLDTLAPALNALGIDSAEYGRRATPLQYIFTCGIGAPRTGLNPRGMSGEREVEASAAMLATERYPTEAARTVGPVHLSSNPQSSLRTEVPEAGLSPASNETWKFFHVSVRGDWERTLGCACASALATALDPASITDQPFLSMPGLSGRSFRRFLNALIGNLGNPRYLELGVGLGSTMAAALHGNHVTAIGVEDFSEGRDTRAALARNIASVDQSKASFTLVERCFNELDTSNLGPFDVLFYDGPVRSSGVFETLSAVLPAMDECAIYLIDDWNSPEMRDGYRRLIAAGFAREIGCIEIRTTLDDSHPPIFGEKSFWHNGCAISVLEKAHRDASSVSPLAISECASAVVPVEQSQPWESKGAIILGPDFSNAQFFQKRSRTATLNGYVLDDVICSFATMLVYKNGRPIRETAYLVSDKDLMAGGPASDQIQRCESSIPVVQPLSRAWKNYYHWVAQTLPAILAGIDKGPGLIALPELTSGQEETIRLLGLHDYPRFRIEIGKSYSFRHLKVSDFVAGRSSFEISLHMQRVFEEMKSRVPDRGVRDRKLYVTRRGAGHRNVYNEADLSVLLEHRGFEVVDPGGYSISEQINLFRGASVIVAPHGAALTNIGFCEPGTIVYELFQSDYANACFNRLAQLVGLQYYADAFPSSDTGQPHTRSFSVDLRRIDSCLDTFLM